MELYIPFKYTGNQNKKYSVYVIKDGKKKLIHFGDARYEQFFDQIGLYPELDHCDAKRRNLYLKRATKIMNKNGEYTYKDKNSSNYWSINYLW